MCRVNTLAYEAFKPEISKYAKGLKREGKVEDRLLLAQMEKQLLEEERKLKELEAANKAEEERRSRAMKADFDAMYKRCRLLAQAAIAFIQEKSKHVEELDSKLVSESITFKPQTNKLTPEMEHKVKQLRQGYKLEKEHSRSPYKDKCKQDAIQAAKDSKQRVQEFLQRNQLAKDRREERVQRLKQELEAQQQQDLAAHKYRSGKHSEQILQENPELKDRGLHERQELFVTRRKEKLNQKRREKQAAEEFFQKATFVPHKDPATSKLKRIEDRSGGDGGESSVESQHRPPQPSPQPQPHQLPPTPPKRQPHKPASRPSSGSVGSGRGTSWEGLSPDQTNAHPVMMSPALDPKREQLRSASTTVPPTGVKHSRNADQSLSRVSRDERGAGADTSAFGWGDGEYAPPEDMEPGQYAFE